MNANSQYNTDSKKMSVIDTTGPIKATGLMIKMSDQKNKSGLIAVKEKNVKDIASS